MNKEIRQFNIRVYGLLINNQNEVLVSDEYLMDTFMTKFPGGGLEFGEGPEDCIKRECKEEFGQEVEIIKHFYTTGFFQKALFFTDHQLISIYYRIRLLSEPKFEIHSKAFDFREKTNGQQSFRWIKIKDFDSRELSFPIDKVVLELLKECYL